MAYELSPMRSRGEAPYNIYPIHECDPAHLLNEQRRNALEEIDKAPFSYVFSCGFAGGLQLWVP
jgi:hypothetical protein